MNARSLLAVILVFGWLAIPVQLPADELKAPLWKGEELPVPPRQHDSWEIDAPPGFEAWIGAARALFDLGLADPRGCEYREIEVTVGSVSREAGFIVKAHGWVLPRKPKQTQDYAVCWNGLVYPVIKVGPPADLRADARGNRYPEGSTIFRRGETVALNGRVPRNCEPSNVALKACLLLRLGEPALAAEAACGERRERLALRDWHPPGRRAASTPVTKPPPEEPPAKLAPDSPTDPLLDWAGQWVWACWDRAVCAHIRGDDALALADLRRLSKVRSGISLDAGRRALRPEGTPQVLEKVEARHLFTWLDESFSRLLADQERRAKSRLAKNRPSEGSMAALIDDLQNVVVVQMSQPGGLESYLNDSVIRRLTTQGEDAVEPLLKAWETAGERLTRSISYGRDFHQSRFVHPISEPIFTALEKVTQIPLEEWRLQPDGATPAAIRKYWQATRGLTAAERWFRLLADDKAGTTLWQYAAGEIVRPMIERRPTFGPGTFAKPGPEDKTAMSGEALRRKTKPSLSELWKRRIPQVVVADDVLNHGYRVRGACEFVCQFAQWDEAAAWPAAVDTMNLLLERAHSDQPLSELERLNLSRYLPQLVKIRTRLGDVQAIDEYSAWLVSSHLAAKRPPLGKVDPLSESARIFQPLWENPERPSVVAAMHTIFDGAEPMAPEFFKNWARAGSFRDLAKTPVLRFAEFRAWLGPALEDRSEYGKESVPVQGPPRPSLLGSNDFVYNDYAAVPYRLCDYFVRELSAWPGMPKIDFTWTDREKDEAVAECAKLLRKPGKIFDGPLPNQP